MAVLFSRVQYVSSYLTLGLGLNFHCCFRNSTSYFSCPVTSCFFLLLLFLSTSWLTSITHLTTSSNVHYISNHLLKYALCNCGLIEIWLKFPYHPARCWPEMKKVKVLVAQSCPTLCDPMACSPPGSSVHGILQARIVEWVAISSARASSQPKDQTCISRIAGRFFTAQLPVKPYSCFIPG